MSSVLYKGRLIPKSVAEAIEKRDYQTLRTLSALGRAEKERRKKSCDKQGVLKLVSNTKTRVPLSAEAKVKAVETRALNKALREEMKAITLADAQRHAEESRAGWDDDYSPS